MSPKHTHVTIHLEDKNFSFDVDGDKKVLPFEFIKDSCWKKYYVEWLNPFAHREAKYVFNWKQYGNENRACGEQFVKLEQYMPFPGPITPLGYKPWTTLAQWSYIARPFPGTIQTNDVICHCYYPEQFPAFGTLTFEIKGPDPWCTGM